MSRPQKEPLRALSPQERAELEVLTRAWNEPAAHVARARALLALADGASFTAAAKAAGRRSGDGVAKLVVRCNSLGLAASARRLHPGRAPTYDEPARQRSLAAARRAPEPAQDGTATWSLSTLPRALRRAPDGLPKIRTYTIRTVLTRAGVRFGRTRSWCPTGPARRKRKAGILWRRWQRGLHRPLSLGEKLPALRMLLVLDNLADRLSVELVCWFFAPGIMPLSTPVGGWWLNLAESMQRLLKRRALEGQPPQNPAEIINLLEDTAEGWNRQPTPFEWGGRRAQRRRRARLRRQNLGGSGARAVRWPRWRAPRAHHWQQNCHSTH